MRHLQDNDKETWNYLKEGNFCCQKNEIPLYQIHEKIVVLRKDDLTWQTRFKFMRLIP